MQDTIHSRGRRSMSHASRPRQVLAELPEPEENECPHYWLATSLRPEIDAGIGHYVGGTQPQVVRTFYLDLPATERIATRARQLREDAGTLTGVALGLDEDEAAREFSPASPRCSAPTPGWSGPRPRPGQFPDRWADVEAEPLSA